MNMSGARVGPFCKLLPIAPSICYEVIAKRTGVDLLSARARTATSLGL